MLPRIEERDARGNKIADVPCYQRHSMYKCRCSNQGIVKRTGVRYVKHSAPPCNCDINVEDTPRKRGKDMILENS